jgi:hypothetical protein
MTPKPKFESQLSVIRVRKNYAAPYLKQKYVYFDRKDIKTERTFKGAMNDRIRNWPDGIYFLKLSTGKVFTRFQVRDGKVVMIFKVSPATGARYPMHEFFMKR